MKKDADRTPARSRPRKKALPAPVETAEDTEPADGRNISPLESGLSVTAGVLFLVAALFPRSTKQLLLLGLGGALVYRGTTSQCGVYKALGIDTNKESLLKQINGKLAAA